ncbi:unnamed protein product [Staurois parvus]|uniref:Uncharacterized protein n=1 Tax=Staurois parvus TaxID=386267 RepID=A0ABN9BPU4_9NEOB|nr:unnamed protein product [Staurois parvus]
MTAGLSVETRPLDDTGSTGLWLRLVLPRPFLCCHICSLLKHCLLCHSSACCLTYSLIQQFRSNRHNYLTFLCPSVTFLCPSVTFLCPSVTILCPSVTILCPSVTFCVPQ